MKPESEIEALAAAYCDEIGAKSFGIRAVATAGYKRGYAAYHGTTDNGAECARYKKALETLRTYFGNKTAIGQIVDKALEAK